MRLSTELDEFGLLRRPTQHLLGWNNRNHIRVVFASTSFSLLVGSESHLFSIHNKLSRWSTYADYGTNCYHFFGATRCNCKCDCQNQIKKCFGIFRTGEPTSARRRAISELVKAFQRWEVGDGMCYVSTIYGHIENEKHCKSANQSLDRQLSANVVRRRSSAFISPFNCIRVATTSLK